MALEDILHRIQKEAQQTVELVMTEAAKQVESIVAEAQKQTDKTKQRLWEGIKQRVEEEKQRKITMARLECQKQLLQEKEAQIENAFSNVLDYLTNLDDNGYRYLVNRLLLAAVKPDEGKAVPLTAVVVTNKERHQLINDVLREVNAKIGSNLHLSSQDAPIKGGFILQYKRQELNCSFEAILQHIREEITHDVAGILFKVKSEK
ncbi:MAG: V-type ATP synthase subunit E [bacterium]|nr:V-type ATP synthase subunit E [bacterium]